MASLSVHTKKIWSVCQSKYSYSKQWLPNEGGNECIGLMSGTTDTSFFAFECAFEPTGFARSIKVSILLLFLPGVVWMAFNLLYVIQSFKKESPLEYVMFRSSVALLAILNASYLRYARHLLPPLKHATPWPGDQIN